MATPKDNWESGVDCVVLSDIGMRRAKNQDSYKVVLATSGEHFDHRGHLFLVADGMGAHAAGELASKLAADEVPHLYAKYSEFSPPDALAKAIQEANSVIHRRGSANPDFHNMGTTASALVLLRQGAILGHVGDSRIYQLSQGTLQQLTFDHSLVWEMRAAGQIPDNDAHAIPKNVITRSLGPNEHVEVDVEGPLPVLPGDVFLLCSDGLTGPVNNSELALILAAFRPRDAVRVLVDLANLRGGPDNVTAVVVRVEAADLTSQSGAKPLATGALARPGASPLAWLPSGVCLLVSLFMLMADQMALAAILGVGALLGLAYALYRQYAGGSEGLLLGEQRRLGRGPYVRQPAPKTAREIDKSLLQLADHLRETGASKWDISWSPFDQLLHQARESGSVRGSFPQAIHELLKEVKDYHQRMASDSSVEL